jgi:hypothetical protein
VEKARAIFSGGGAASVGALALGMEMTAMVAAGAPPPSGGSTREAPA